MIFHQPVCDAINFEINLIFLSYLPYMFYSSRIFFYMTKNSRRKLKHLENEKSFQDKIKRFFIIFEGLLLKQIKQTFLEGESPILSKYLPLKLKICHNNVFKQILFSSKSLTTLIYLIVLPSS